MFLKVQTILYELSVNTTPIPSYLINMVISPINRILGHIIDTRRLTVDTLANFLNPLHAHLTTTWGPHRKSFTVLEAETLVGQLGHVSFAAPWLKHLISSLSVSCRRTAIE